MVKAPPSKSYAQRAIAAALLARGRTTRLVNMGLCSDTAAALAVASSLGARHEVADETTYLIRGGLTPAISTIDIGESGLSARMFTPIAALCDVPITITGRGTVAARPMDMIIDPLRELGVSVGSGAGGRLPLTVCGPVRGRDATVDGRVSSQFITGLLMALPLAAADTTFTVVNPRSTPYIDMTLDILERFGIEVCHRGYTQFYVEGRQSYAPPREYVIEGDWSAASCILVAGAIAGEVTVSNLNPLSKQADMAVLDALARAGAEIVIAENSVTVCRPAGEELQAFKFDATNCPDLFPALVALAVNCVGVSEITGVSRLLHKETNRAETLCEVFGKMGANVGFSMQDDVMRIRGGRLHGARVSSYGDHRIAMSAAVAALRAESAVEIDAAEAVDKSYPAFWDDLQAITQ